jgi:hypothetical protein
MIIKFQIIKSVVIEAVKSATYLKAKIDSASDDRATKLGFNEAAGDDAVHESVLTHDFQTALEIVKTFFVDYLVPNAQTIGDNVIYYNSVTDDNVDFVLDVSRRYNGTLTDALARLTSKYVEDYMLFQWWLKATNQKQAEPYQALLAIDEQNIRKCFILCGPIVPTTSFPTELAIKVNGEDVSGEISIPVGEEVALSYSLNDGAVDDIEARSEIPRIVEIHRSRDAASFTLLAKSTGVSTVKLWSRHSDDLEFSCDVVVTGEGEV